MERWGGLECPSRGESFHANLRDFNLFWSVSETNSASLWSPSLCRSQISLSDRRMWPRRRRCCGGRRRRRTATPTSRCRTSRRVGATDWHSARSFIETGQCWMMDHGQFLNQISTTIGVMGGIVFSIISVTCVNLELEALIQSFGRSTQFSSLKNSEAAKNKNY